MNIIYKDFPAGIKEKSEVSTDDVQAFVDMDRLKSEQIYDTKYGTLETDYWFADGTFGVLGEYTYPDPTLAGYCSESLSDEDGLFNEPVVIEVDFSQKFTATGLSLSYTPTGDEPKDLTIRWLDDGVSVGFWDSAEDEAERLSDMTVFYPQLVASFNKIIISVTSMNRPYRYLKLSGIDYGKVREIPASEIKNCSIHEEISLVSESLPINTLKFDFVSDEQYLFRSKQALIAQHNNEMLGKFYVDSEAEKRGREYSVPAYSQLGLLDKSMYKGGIYSVDDSGDISNPVYATDVFEDILSGEPIEYEIDSYFDDVVVAGYIPRVTKREALGKVAVAVGAVIDDTRGNFKIKKQTTNTPTTISPERTYMGVDYKNALTVTAVTASPYLVHIPIEQIDGTDVYQGDFEYNVPTTIYPSQIVDVDSIDVYYFRRSTREKLEDYQYEIDASPNEITLTIKDASIAENYHIAINAFTWETYELRPHTKKNPQALASDADNVISVEKNTLITEHNVDTVLNNVYNGYIQNDEVNAQVKLTDEHVGQRVTVTSETGEEYTGTIKSIDMDVQVSKVGTVVLRVG